MTTHDLNTLKERLIEIFVEVNEGRLILTLEQSSQPLKELGLESVGLLNFLVAIEDDLGIEWSLDVERQVFTSIDTIAGYLDGLDQATR